MKEDTKHDQEEAKIVLEEAGNILEKIPMSKEIRSILEEKIPDPNERARVWVGIIKGHVSEEIVSPGLEWIDQDLEVLSELLACVTDHYLYCTVLLEIIHIYEEKDEPNHIEYFLEEVCEVIDLISDEDKKMEILLKISEAYRSSDFYQFSLEIGQKALYIARRSKNDFKIMKILEEITQEWEEYCETDQGKDFLLQAYQEISHTYRSNGHFQEALEVLKKIGSIVMTWRNNPQKLETLKKVAKNCEQYGELEGSKVFLEELKNTISNIKKPCLSLAVRFLKKSFNHIQTEKSESKKLKQLKEIAKRCELYCELEEGRVLLEEVKNTISKIQK